VQLFQRDVSDEIDMRGRSFDAVALGKWGDVPVIPPGPEDGRKGVAIALSGPQGGAELSIRHEEALVWITFICRVAFLVRLL
jgi:hypothetical protein